MMKMKLLALACGLVSLAVMSAGAATASPSTMSSAAESIRLAQMRAPACRMVTEWVPQCNHSCTYRDVRQGGAIVRQQNCQWTGCQRSRRVCN